MLTVTTLLGASWSVSSRLAGRVIDFAMLLILARVLAPADFGLTALALSFVVVVETVLELQLIQALTRIRHIEKAHIDTAFTLGVIRACVIFALVAAAAWPLSILYNEPKLFTLVIVLTIGSAARGLISPNMVKFFRQLSFRQVFIVEVSGKVGAALLALLVLYLGGGYWAIAVNSIASSATAAAISYVLAPYWPKLCMREWPEFRELVGWLSFSQMVSALNWQLDRLILGHFIPRPTLGQYTMAGDLAALPTQSLIGPAMQPLLAAFATIHHDAERMKRAFLKASRFAMLIAVPACVGMSLTADLIVSVLLGPKWAEAAPYLQWLSLTIILNAYYQPFYALALVNNRTKSVFQLSLIELMLRILIVPVAIYYFSIMGVIVARGALAIMMFVLTMTQTRRLLQASVRSQLINLWKIAVASASMALFVAILRQPLTGLELPAILDLALVCGLGAGVYAGLLYALGVRLRTSDARFI